MKSIDRRTFLLATGALVMVACSSDGEEAGGSPHLHGDGDEAGDSGGGNSGGGDAGDGFILVERFPRNLTVPGPLRLAYSIADAATGDVQSDGPDTLSGRIVDIDGSVVVDGLQASKRRVSEGIVYWAFRPTIETIGTYTLQVEGGTKDGSAIGVYDPATISVPSFGQQLPPFDTPTTTDAAGVDPICTRVEGGPCPFHDITLTEALASGKPVAYIIGTPAHCEFGTCAPGLEFLINSAARLGDALIVVHSEVFTDDSATVPAPAVEAYSLDFEPVIFLADRSGQIVGRLEGAWDQTELDESLDALVA